MTHSGETESEATWAIEIEKEVGAGATSSDFYSVTEFQAGPDGVRIVTSGGTQLSFKPESVRKVLLMRPKTAAVEATG